MEHHGMQRTPSEANSHGEWSNGSPEGSRPGESLANPLTKDHGTWPMRIELVFGDKPNQRKWVEVPGIPREGDQIMLRGPDYFDQSVVAEIRWTIYPDNPESTFCRVVCTEPVREWDPPPEPISFKGALDRYGMPRPNPNVSPETPGEPL